MTAQSNSFEELARTLNARPSEEPIVPKTARQADLMASIRRNILSFAIGPAGTGKTYIGAAMAAEAFIEREVDRIFITRPNVESGAPMGFLPGELDEKFDPWFAPVRTELEKRLGRGCVEMFVKNERIIPLPLAFMRGWTLDNAFVLFDEAQNATPKEMKMFLTRIGEGARVVIDGDISPHQRDIAGPSGLDDALEKLRGMAGVGRVDFTRADIVRSGFCQEVCERYGD